MDYRKPYITTDKTPDSIVLDDMPLLEMHFKSAVKATSTEEHDRLTKDFTLAEKTKIKVIYEELRNNGYYPHHIDQYGNIIFYTPKQDNIQALIQNRYPLKCDNCTCEDKCEGYTLEQINYFKSMARREVPISSWPEKVFNKGE